MGNIVSRRRRKQDVTEYFVDYEECKLLQEYWSEKHEHNQNLFLLSWCAATDSNPEMQDIFGTASDDPLQHPMVRKTVDAIENVFDSLIMRHNLKKNDCEQICQTLGARHLNYSPIGFTTSYWDTFINCLLRTFDETIHMKGKKRFDMVRAWRNLLHLIVENMKIGYRRQISCKFGSETVIIP